MNSDVKISNDDYIMTMVDNSDDSPLLVMIIIQYLVDD